MTAFLDDKQFDFVSKENKKIIHALDQELGELGYDFGGNIGSGYCWGKYMLIYRKSGVKSEKVYARVYLRDTSIVLRLFLNDIDKHRLFLENAPTHIKSVFTGPHGDCEHCHNEKDGRCRFRKTYTLDNQMIEKCNGIVFEFRDPKLEYLGDYLALFSEFYPQRKSP